MLWRFEIACVAAELNPGIVQQGMTTSEGRDRRYDRSLQLSRESCDENSSSLLTNIGIEVIRIIVDVI